MKNYIKEYESELIQFLFLCGMRDKTLLLLPPKKADISEYVRLACLSLVFGYKKMFFKIIAITEKYINDFVKELDSLNGNYNKLDGWIDDFIENTEICELKDIMREYRTEIKQKINCENFKVKQLIKL